MTYSQQDLENYLKKAEEVLAKKNANFLSEADVTNMAKELGFDLNQVAEATQNFWIKGQLHHRYDNYEDAAEAYEQLATLSPKNFDVVWELTQIYFKEMTQNDDLSYKTKAWMSAKRCIELDSSRPEPFEIISKLKKVPYVDHIYNVDYYDQKAEEIFLGVASKETIEEIKKHADDAEYLMLKEADGNTLTEEESEEKNRVASTGQEMLEQLEGILPKELQYERVYYLEQRDKIKEQISDTIYKKKIATPPPPPAPVKASEIEPVKIGIDDVGLYIFMVLLGWGAVEIVGAVWRFFTK